MKQRRIIISVAALLGLALSTGCQKEMEAPDGEMNLREMTFHAGWADDTKTVLQDDGKSIYWSPSDEISVFAGNGQNGGSKFTSTNGTESASVTFKGSLAGNGSTYYALYPYDANAICNENIITTSIPSEQIAKEGTFADGSMLSVAITTDDHLYFKNVCSGIKFSVAHDNIKKLVFRSSSYEPIAGKINITLSNSGNPEISVTEGLVSVTVSAPDDGCFKEGKYYYATLCPGSQSSFDIEYYTSDNKVGILEYHSLELSRSVFKRLNKADDGLKFYAIHEKIAGLYGNQLLPDNVDKSKITNVSFAVNSSKTTDITIPSGSSEPIYFELDGTTAKYYTGAEVYELLSAMNMFSGWSSLQTVDFSGFISPHLNGMFGMFSGCQSLQSVNLADLSTSSVTDMGEMFWNCNQLKQLDLSSFDTRNVMSMHGMFYNCNSLESVNVSSFSTDKVTSLDHIFDHCSKLKVLDLSSFKTANVSNFLAMFQFCYSLECLDISSFSYDNCTDFEGMFSYCKRLMYLNLGTGNLQNIGGSAFQQFASSIPYAYIRCSDNSKDVLQGADVISNISKVIWVGTDETMPAYSSYKDPSLYYSTDYSKDKSVTVVQKSKTGEGADLIFIGDAYSDRLISDGTYDTDLDSAIDAVFSLEPMSSYKDLFNIYKVYAVSENEIVGNNTALQTNTGNDGYMMSSSYLCNSYAALACPGTGIDGTGTTYNNATIIVVINSDNDSGISYMSTSGAESYISDYGQSCEAMAFVGKGTDNTVFKQTILHEFGHAFAKLADEYYSGDSEIDADAVLYMKQYETNTGFNKNVDYTSDSGTIKWSKFIDDSRYAGENIGAFEGGEANYAKGVWRPTENSIMRDIAQKFNAPSREAIYYRIHKLAYGDSWTYDYETFVQQDLKNIPSATKSAAVTRASSLATRSKANHVFNVTKSKSSDGKILTTIITD